MSNGAQAGGEGGQASVAYEASALLAATIE